MSGCASRAAANRNSAGRFVASLSSASIGNGKDRVAFRIISRPNPGPGFYKLRAGSSCGVSAGCYPAGRIRPRYPSRDMTCGALVPTLEPSCNLQTSSSPLRRPQRRKATPLDTNKAKLKIIRPTPIKILTSRLQSITVHRG